MTITDAHIHFRDTSLAQDVGNLMKASGISEWNVLSIPDGHVNGNPQCFLLKNKFPEETTVFATYDTAHLIDGIERTLVLPPGEQLDRLIAVGVHGVKIIDGKPTFYLRMREQGLSWHDGFFDDFFSAIEERGLPILWHVADPEEFWDPEKVPTWAVERGWAYTDGGFPSKENIYQEVEGVLTRHPDLKIIFPHFYFLSADLSRAARFLQDHPGVCLDLTPGIEMYHNFTATYDDSRRFFLEFQDRIIFGTDSMDGYYRDIETGKVRIELVRRWMETDDEFPAPDRQSLIHGVALPRSVLHKIYQRNFRSLLLANRSWSTDLAVEETVRLLAVAEAEGNEKAVRAFETVLDDLSLSGPN